MRRVVLALLVMCFVQASNAQTTEQTQRMRMAAAHEMGGNNEDAARMYLELYDEGVTTDQVFGGVVRTMTSLGNVQGLIPIVKDRYTMQPNTGLEMLLGSLYAQSGRLDSADVWWTNAIESAQNKMATHAELGAIQTQLRLTDRAIASLRAAQGLSSNPSEYSEQLSKLFMAKGNITEAVNEILLLHASRPDVQGTMGRLSAVMMDSAATEIVGKKVRSLESSVQGSDELKAWYEQHIGNWEGALEITKRIDNTYSMGGNQVLRFADQARRAGAYDAALKAYGSLFDAPKQTALAAAYGYAVTLEQQLAGTRQLTKQQAESVLARYSKIIEQHADHPLSASAMVRSAEIEATVMNNRERARDLLTAVTNRWRGTSDAAEGAILLAKLFVEENRLDAALDIINLHFGETSKGYPEFRDQARLLAADIELFKGNFNEARHQFLQLSSSTASVAANDAIDRLGVMMLMEEDSAGVAAYFEASFFAARRQVSDAARSFVKASEITRNAELKDRCLYNAAELLVEDNKIERAEEYLQAILANIPESTFGDRALVLSADILVIRNDIPGAIAALTTVLVQYPRSILAPECRERIRRLRGDA